MHFLSEVRFCSGVQGDAVAEHPWSFAVAFPFDHNAVEHGAPFESFLRALCTSMCGIGSLSFLAKIITGLSMRASTFIGRSTPVMVA